ncbi:DUF397 domain-containing protein [Streptomyces sp. NPDC059743]|uniref:DUF397 domain-containing protein n=1 Tax=Streptomyces sp. NPDC059743 TaxID=3346928 RepID=UPI003669DD39
MASASARGLEWVKSSYSGQNGDCVEVAALPAGGHALRDSKNPHGPVLLLGPGQWSAFVSGVTAGEFR